MGVVVISLLIEAADADAPAAVLIPAQGFHRAAFDGDYRTSHGGHKVVSQMAAAVAVAAAGSEIVKILVVKAVGDGRKGLEPVGFFPGIFAHLFIGNADLIFPQHPLQNRTVGAAVVIEILHIFRQGSH